MGSASRTDMWAKFLNLERSLSQVEEWGLIDRWRGWWNHLNCPWSLDGCVVSEVGQGRANSDHVGEVRIYR